MIPSHMSILHRRPSGISSRHPQTVLALLLFIAVTSSTAPLRASNPQSDADRPNIVWIMTEDNSVHYNKAYFDTGYEMPAFDALCEEGLLFERAYSCAPVCSVARTTLITGCYAPRLATQYHRRSAMIALPDNLKMFPAYLRDAGYFTTNNRKEDYNALGTKAAWDISSKNAHWRKRPTPETPFFHVQTFTTTHESSLHFNASQAKELISDTERLTRYEPPSFLPDTPLVRATLLRYDQRHAQLNNEIESLIRELHTDGVWENTIVFCFGDHGGVLPRSKGYIYDTGLHVPLAVRIPKKYRDRWGIKAGQRDNRFVEFVDFGPTVLNMAGLKTPESMDGDAFLGDSPADDSRFTDALGYADRFDEKYDLTRSLHRGTFHYIRNYQPFYSDSLQNNYRYKMLAYQEWRKLFQEGKLDKSQSAFFLPRPKEMLFDLSQDPYEINNLASDPDYQDLLFEMRTDLRERLSDLPDTSFIPEPFAVPKAQPNPNEFASANRTRIGELISIADLALQSTDKVNDQWHAAIASDDPWARYWAATVAASYGKAIPRDWVDALNKRIDDEQALVKCRSAIALAVATGRDPCDDVVAALQTSQSEFETLMIFNEIVHVRDDLGFESFSPDALKKTGFSQGEVQRRLEYLIPVSP